MTKTKKTAGEVLEKFWNDTLFEYGTEYAGNGGIPDYNKPKAEALAALREIVEEILITGKKRHTCNGICDDQMVCLNTDAVRQAIRERF